MHLFCFGMGFSAQHLAASLDRKAWTIAGTVRDADAAQVLRFGGIEAFVYDGAQRNDALVASLTRATHLLLSIPPGAAGDPVLRHYRDDLANAPDLKWIGYLSTVGVYGDHDGAWIDETTACAPISERSRRRFAAEQEWLDFASTSGKRVVLFRLAGIYGPGRSAIDTVRSGRARRVIKAGQSFNRIHVADIARVCLASMQGRGNAPIYNVADDEPAPPQDVIAHAATLLNLPLPPAIPFDEAELSPMAASFYGENKRVRNNLMKCELGVTLAYPTYREGLAALAAMARAAE